ncbi:hypothetical protein MLD52_09460 [Puniceicoccaceae bacterium K14]|nr:hypothetical protein [Puniceicoccaceae bacterium K14]
MKNITKFTRFLILAVAAWATAAFAQAGGDYDQPAISGYDVVSYFQDSGPVRGTGFHVHEYEGAIFLFATEANKDAFAKSPEKYLPEFNGYCAFGVSLGKKFHSNPEVFEVVEGKLYLNLDTDIQSKWRADLSESIAKGHAQWKSIADKSASEL